MKQSLTGLVFLILPFLLLGQSRRIPLAGILTTKRGQAISGCSVYIKGTRTQTQTRLCGEFEIDIDDNYEGTLVFSCLAPGTWEIPLKKLKGKEKIIISLTGWTDFENGGCDKNYSQEKRIKIK